MKRARNNAFRQVGFLAALIVYWLVICFPKLLQLNPSAFADSGAQIICISITAIAFNRVRYEKHLLALERNYVDRWMDYLSSYDELIDKRANYTFTLHQYELSKINAKIGNKDGFHFANPDEEKELRTWLNENIKEDFGEEIRLKKRRLDDAIAQLRSESRRWKWWDSKSIRAEWCLVILGTLQTAYGDNLVILLQSDGFSVFSSHLSDLITAPRSNFPPYDSPGLV